MYMKVRIRKHERGILTRHGDFVRLLGPGVYRLLWGRGGKIEIANALATRFTHALLDVIAASPRADEKLKIVDLRDDERGLIWKDGRLAYVVGPGRHAFWRTPAALHVDVCNIAETPRLAHERQDTILAHSDARTWLDGVDIEAGETALLVRNGRIVEQLGPGRHVFWKGAGRTTWKTVDLKEQITEVSGQELTTADKVSLRLTLIVTHRVTDPLAATTLVSNANLAVYREAQLALRTAVGARTLDALLAGKDAVGNEVRAAVAARAAEFGVAIIGAGIRDVILPGPMREIFNTVILAEKEAQANLIRRREETAAARSEANTAKLLAENPLLVRMRELEALKGILEGAKLNLVLGNSDLAGQLRAIVTSEQIATRGPGREGSEVI